MLRGLLVSLTWASGSRAAAVVPRFAFQGPPSSFNAMLGGFDSVELGLVVAAGPSKVCDGMGLFLSLSEDTAEVEVPAGTVLCGYSRIGDFQSSWAGDKTVGFRFDDLDTGVIFEKRLQPLREALAGTGRRVAGHEVVGSVIRSVSSPMLFVPTQLDATDERAFTPAQIGVCCNDLAFDSADAADAEVGNGARKARYIERAARLNVLELVWRLEPSAADPMLLVPTWPVVIFARDVLFDSHTNAEPREVGLSYGYGYWEGKHFLQ